MKSFSHFILLSFFIIFSATLGAQKIRSGNEKGASFNFENSQFSAISLYKEIAQSEIKALRLSFRVIVDTIQVNSFLFKPDAREGNRTNLADLLLWAIEKGNLIAYKPWSEYFAEPISWEEIKREYIPARIETIDEGSGRMYDTIVTPTNITTEEVKSYLLMESTIIGLNNKVLAVRPIGLCPIRTTEDVEIGRISKRQLFWVYFPDIMSILSNHYPETKIKGVKTTLDFFTKNRYVGDYFSFYHTDSPLLEGQLVGDTTRFVEGFDVNWIYDKIKEGMFINPQSKLYQGHGKHEMLLNSEPAKEGIINPATVSCAKYVYTTIDLRDIENYPLYFPEQPFLARRSLIDVIYRGIEDGRFIVYQPYDSIPMTFQEVEKSMGGGNEFIQIQDLKGEFLDTAIMRQADKSEVKRYLIKEVEFYDEKGTLIHSRILGLMPIREWSDEPDPYGIITARIYKSKLFYVPFNNSEVGKLLSQNYAYRFTSDDNSSFLSFFQNRKYKAEKVEKEVASISTALKECGIQSPEEKFKIPVLPELPLRSDEKAKIVFREVLRSDTANHQLFYPEIEANRLKDLIDILMYCIEKETITSYSYNPEGEFTSGLKPDDVKEITRSVITSYVPPVLGYDTIIMRGPEKPVIKKYIIKELHIGSGVYIMGVSPVQEYYESPAYYGYLKSEPAIINTFWVPFTDTLWKELGKTEIFRVNCEPEKTFGEYFAKLRYSGSIISEKEISVSEAEKIISRMKK